MTGKRGRHIIKMNQASHSHRRAAHKKLVGAHPGRSCIQSMDPRHNRSRCMGKMPNSTLGFAAKLCTLYLSFDKHLCYTSFDIDAFKGETSPFLRASPNSSCFSRMPCMYRVG